MLEHHLQKQMLHTLIKYDAARFADLRPKQVDSNIATYHLQQLIKQGLVEKRDSRYYATAQGKVAGATVTLTHTEQLAQAHTVFFIAAQNSEGAWLLRKRHFHPMLHKSGFVHGEPTAGQAISETAAATLVEKTGLSAASFTVRGSGYFTLLNERSLPESFIHFTLLVATGVTGELIAERGSGENYWYSGDFNEEDLVPSMSVLMNLLQQKPEHFYVDLTYTTNHERN